MKSFPIILTTSKSLIIDLILLQEPEQLPSKNPEEAHFYWYYLNRYFPDKIQRNYSFLSYTPDFIYCDDKHKLYIDIEIDEPYIYETGEPTHYQRLKSETKRNETFLGIGWLVMRFAEEQIIRYPESCCKTIAQVIAKFTKDNSILTQFNHITDLELIPQWTEPQARQLAQEKYRNTYLNTYYSDTLPLSNSEIITNLQAFVNLESETKVQSVQETWNLPLTERVAQGKAIANLEIINFNNDEITLKFTENISKFTPGDELILSQDAPQGSDTYKVTLEAEKDNLLIVKSSKRFAFDLENTTNWTLDQALINLPHLQRDPLSKIEYNPDLSDRLLGILQGKIPPEFSQVDLNYPQIKQLNEKQQEAFIKFDTIFFDEAGQITLPIALRGMMGGSKYIFIGDHQQMSPVISAKHHQQWVTNSIFATLFSHSPGTMLNITHRLNADINSFPSQHFYENKLQPSPEAANRKLELKQQPQTYADVLAPNSSNLFIEVNHQNQTLSSPEEAEIIAGIVKEAIACGINPHEIGVVTPYRGQVRLIRQKIQEITNKNEQEKLASVLVNTVESMQGQEKDIMIVSLVTSDPNYAAERAEFYFNVNRLNVAITRARVKRIVVGSPTVFDVKPQEQTHEKWVNCFQEFYQSCEIISIDKTEPEPIISPGISKILEALGLFENKIFPTNDGQKSNNLTVFKYHEKYQINKPFLIIKTEDIEFQAESPDYQILINNLKQDLLEPTYHTVKFGIITNEKQIQLFKKHGKVVHPITLIKNINPENFTSVTAEIKEKIDNSTRALTIAVYNNKGGVGKTTTTINVAAMLTAHHKKVLIIDFDCNQQDLTSNLGLEKIKSKVSLYEALDAKDNLLKQCLISYSLNKKFTLDVITSDSALINVNNADLLQRIEISRLSELLEPLKQEYDYILIDTPPNWTFFSQSSLCAADVVFIPTQHNGFNSLENAATVITEYIPEVQEYKVNHTVTALPIFFNKGKTTPAQLKSVHRKLDSIILNVKNSKNLNLLPYFYPKSTNLTQKKDIFHLQESAYIPQADLYQKPAVVQYKKAYDAYQNLVKEYFI